MLYNNNRITIRVLQISDSNSRVYFVVAEEKFRQLLCLREPQQTFQPISTNIEFSQRPQPGEIQRTQYFDLIAS